jgi:hypothetical protein
MRFAAVTDKLRSFGASSLRWVGKDGLGCPWLDYIPFEMYPKMCFSVVDADLDEHRVNGT